MYARRNTVRRRESRLVVGVYYLQVQRSTSPGGAREMYIDNADRYCYYDTALSSSTGGPVNGVG